VSFPCTIQWERKPFWDISVAQRGHETTKTRCGSFQSEQYLIVRSCQWIGFLRLLHVFQLPVVTNCRLCPVGRSLLLLLYLWGARPIDQRVTGGRVVGLAVTGLVVTVVVGPAVVLLVVEFAMCCLTVSISSPNVCSCLIQVQMESVKAAVFL
jgi:hypothetical protein